MRERDREIDGGRGEGSLIPAESLKYAEGPWLPRKHMGFGGGAWGERGEGEGAS